MKLTKNWIRSAALVLLVFSGCSVSQNPSEQADEFLRDYYAEFLDLYSTASEAEWRANTYIKEGDEETSESANRAKEALARFTGSQFNILSARELLAQASELTPLQVRQLEAVLYAAADNPQTVPELVEERISVETRQNETLFGFDFQVDGESIDTNTIDRLLREETDLDERLEVWRASKEVGKPLKEGLVDLRRLRNATVQALEYNDFFSYQVSNYQMDTDEMLRLTRRLVREVWPLYRQLHTYARYELAERYGLADPPTMLPAHWLPNRWGQDWSSMVSVEGLDLDAALEKKSAQWLVEQGERFYISIGFPGLPETFWERSSLYPLPEDADHKKNNHASAWHMDLQNDVRCLMSVTPEASWYETAHHELGHIYYFLSYSNPDVPYLLRAGANRGFHEAVGSLLGLAAMQPPFIEEIGLRSEEDPDVDMMGSLLKEALNYVVFIPWSAGVMTEFEHALYSEELPEEEFNSKWWDLKGRLQGIIPPEDRGLEFCDAASKTHINNDAAQYYDYALSFVLLFQLHDYIATEILEQDPHATNYFGQEEVGDFLREILEVGATVDWRRLLEEKLGGSLSAQAMLHYFEPLTAHLEEVNRDRRHTLPPEPSFP